jgi:hypothetical protein
MSLEDALHALEDQPNQQISWTLGDLLKERAARDDWRHCSVLQHLEVGAPNLEPWNQLLRRTREGLANEESLRSKARQLLQPRSPTFDQALDDFIAEMVAVLYLASLGHQNIRFLAETDAITADLLSTHDDKSYVTEAKNLREPKSLTYVAFAQWHHNRAAQPQIFNFAAEFLELEDPFDDLTAEQVTAVRNLVDTLPAQRRPSVFVRTLPGGRNLRVRLSDGPGVMLRHGPGPFLVNEVVEECRRAVVLKLLEPTRKALTQLYSTAVPPAYRRLLFVLWRPPDEIQAIGEQDNVRAVVRDHCQEFVRKFFQNFALSILYAGEEPANAPRSSWP